MAEQPTANPGTALLACILIYSPLGSHSLAKMSDDDDKDGDFVGESSLG